MSTGLSTGLSNLTGPLPAVQSTYDLQTSQTIYYRVYNNASGFRPPITVTGISGAISRVTAINDCGDYLPTAGTYCQIGVQIFPQNQDAGQTVNQTLSIDYQSRVPLTSKIQFQVSASVLSTSNPSNVTTNVDYTASFSTTASGGTSPYTYQWQLSTNAGSSFSNIVGATNSSYTTPSLSLGNNNDEYRVIVTDATTHSVTSSPATLTVNGALTTTNPSNVTTNVGLTAAFSTTASAGTPPYSYQWQLNPQGTGSFSSISGATSASYTTPTLSSGDNNNQYRVVVHDSINSSVTSSPATLTVNGALTTSTPSNVTTNVGLTAAFSTTASDGTPPYSYQWQLNPQGTGSFSNISGATSSSYTTPTLSSGDNNNQYRVIVTDAVDSTATSGSATLTVNGALATTNPSNATANVGQTAGFSTTASSGTPPYTYQWQLSTNSGSSFSNISGATSSSYTTPTLSSGDNNNQYRVRVTDAVADSVTSSAATLTVSNPTCAGQGGYVLTTTPGPTTNCWFNNDGFTLNCNNYCVSKGRTLTNPGQPNSGNIASSVCSTLFSQTPTDGGANATSLILSSGGICQYFSGAGWNFGPQGVALACPCSPD